MLKKIIGIIIFNFILLSQVIAEEKKDESISPINSKDVSNSFGYFSVGIDSIPVYGGLSLGGGYRYRNAEHGMDYSLKYTSLFLIFNELDARIFYLHYPKSNIRSSPYLGIGGSIGGFVATVGSGTAFGIATPLLIFGYQHCNSNFLQLEIGVPFYLNGRDHRDAFIPIKIGLNYNFAF
jgi:hypothetical protein